MIHVHVRKEDGSHLLDADAYRARSQHRAAVGDRMVIQITSEALGIYSAGRADRSRQGGPARGRVSGAQRTGSRTKRTRLPLRIFCRGLPGEGFAADHPYDPEEAVRLDGHGGDEVCFPATIFRAVRTRSLYAGAKIPPRGSAAFLAPGMPAYTHWSVCAFGRTRRPASQPQRSSAAMSASASKTISGFRKERPPRSNADLVHGCSCASAAAVPLLQGPALATDAYPYRFCGPAEG